MSFLILLSCKTTKKPQNQTSRQTKKQKPNNRLHQSSYPKYGILEVVSLRQTNWKSPVFHSIGIYLLRTYVHRPGEDGIEEKVRQRKNKILPNWFRSSSVTKCLHC